MIDDTIVELTDQVGLGVGAVCRAVGRPRATHHRRTSPRYGPPAPPASRKGQHHPRSLSAAERRETLAVLHSERFVESGRSPATVMAHFGHLRSVPYVLMPWPSCVARWTR